MKKEVRTVVYDDDLHIEAYRFEGIVQPFPNHFHEYYVIGFVEEGERALYCKNQEYTVKRGNILLFNRATTMPVCRVMRERWTTAVSTSPRGSCWTWPKKSPAGGNFPVSPAV